MMEKLAIKKEYSIIFSEESSVYNESQWWSRTNISGAILHHVMWEGEYYGARGAFIIIGLPDGVCEDSQVVLKRIQKVLESFSCVNISDLSRNEMVDIHSESGKKIEYARALWEKAQELKVPGDILAQLKIDIDHKDLERLIKHELPWRNTPELISDIRVYVNEIQEICARLKIEMPKEVLPYIVTYSNYVISRYEKDIEEGNDPLWAYSNFNSKEYKEKNTAIFTEMIKGLKEFIALANNEELSQRFSVIETELIRQWDKKGQRYNTLWEKIRYIVDEILWFLGL